MAFDQDITYRVNIDDSNFQSKLTQLRSSLDASLSSGGGGMGGGLTSAYAMAQLGGGGGGSTMSMGGMADFGSMIKPVTYTPPAIAMQPHFGMMQIQQTLGQAGLGAMGPIGSAIYGAGSAMGGFMRGGLEGASRAANLVPNNITAKEYYDASAQAFGNRAGDAAAMGALTAMNMAAAIPFMSAGSAIGSAVFGGAAATGGMALLASGGALLGGTAAAMIPAAYTSAVGDAYRENVATQEALQAGSFRFISGTSPDVDQTRGRGFSRAAREKVAKGIQEMSLHDPRYGSQEYRQILEGGMQNDLFSGTRDTQEFQTKFKGLVESVKTITSTLHTSLKEGIEVIRGFRDMGVTDPAQINRMVLGSEVMGRASGRTGMEMMAIGQTGAEMFRGTGISMARGFELNQMNTMDIRRGLDHGTISRETVMQAGGENAFAQQMTANTLSSFQSTLGRGMLMGAFDPKTGTLDMNRMLRPRDAQSTAMSATGLGPQGMLALEARQEELISQMSPMQMRMFAVNQSVGIAMTLKNAGYAKTMEDAMFHAGRMQGHSTSQIKADLEFMQQDPEKFKKDQEAAINSVRAQAALEDIRNKFNPIKKASDWLKTKFVEPVSHTLLDIRSAVSGSVEEVGRNLTGQSSIKAEYLSKETQAIAARGAATEIGVIDASSANSTYRDILGGGSTTTKSLERFTGASIEKDFVPGTDGDRVAVERIKAANGVGEALAFRTKEEVYAYNKRTGRNMTILGETAVDVGRGRGLTEKRFIAQEKEQQQKELKDKRDLQVTEDDIKKSEDFKITERVLDNVSAKAEELHKAGKKLTVDELTKFTFNKKAEYSKLSAHDKGIIIRLARAGGVHTKDVREEIEKRQDTGADVSLINASREELSSIVDRERKEITTILERDPRNKMNMADWRGASAAEQMELLEARGDKKKEAAAIRHLTSRGMSEEKARNLVGAIGGLSKKTFDELTPHEMREKGALKATSRLEDEATGAKPGTAAASGGAQSVGELSKDTLVQVEKMSKALVENYKRLMEMQALFDTKQAAIKRGPSG